MLAALLCSLAIAANPVAEIVDLHPGSSRVLSRDGQRLVHLGGFAALTGARTPEAAARTFLSAHGAAFGITARHRLVLQGVPVAGAVGPVRFGRTIDGLPIFGGASGGGGCSAAGEVPALALALLGLLRSGRRRRSTKVGA